MPAAYEPTELYHAYQACLPRPAYLNRPSRSAIVTGCGLSLSSPTKYEPRVLLFLTAPAAVPRSQPRMQNFVIWKQAFLPARTPSTGTFPTPAVFPRTHDVESYKQLSTRHPVPLLTLHSFLHSARQSRALEPSFLFKKGYAIEMERHKMPCS